MAINQKAVNPGRKEIPRNGTTIIEIPIGITGTTTTTTTGDTTTTTGGTITTTTTGETTTTGVTETVTTTTTIMVETITEAMEGTKTERDGSSTDVLESSSILTRSES
jgi:hypothetical protein